MATGKSIHTLVIAACVCRAGITIIATHWSVGASISFAAIYGAKITVIAEVLINTTGRAAKSGQAEGKAVINRAGKSIITIGIGGTVSALSPAGVAILTGSKQPNCCITNIHRTINAVITAAWTKPAGIRVKRNGLANSPLASVKRAGVIIGAFRNMDARPCGITGVNRAGIAIVTAY